MVISKKNTTLHDKNRHWMIAYRSQMQPLIQHLFQGQKHRKHFWRGIRMDRQTGRLSYTDAEMDLKSFPISFRWTQSKFDISFLKWLIWNIWKEKKLCTNFRVLWWMDLENAGQIKKGEHDNTKKKISAFFMTLMIEKRCSEVFLPWSICQSIMS